MMYHDAKSCSDETAYDGVQGDPARRRVLDAACSLFARNGYHATTIRTIADSSGISVPGLYYHYASKQAILDALVDAAISEMLSLTERADAASDGTALGRFDAVVSTLLRFHLVRRDEAFVASTEMRSMEPDVLKRHVAKRDEQQMMVQQIIEQGATEGVFVPEHAKEIARSVASLCVSVSSWYREDGRLPPEELTQRYLEITRRLVAARGAAPREASQGR